MTFQQLDIVSFTEDAQLPEGHDTEGHIIQPSKSHPGYYWVGVGLGENVFAFRRPSSVLRLVQRLRPTA